MRTLARLLRLIFALAAGAVSLLSVLAFLGFGSSWLDLFNHLQPLLFTSTLAALLIAPLVLPEGAGRAFILATAATGFVASAVPIVPEAVSALAPREPPPGDGRRVVRLMTHNLFGINYDMARVARVIAAENPDIVALQEFFPEQAEALDPLLTPFFPHSVRCFGGKRANIALYSKLPLEQTMDGACGPDASSGQRTARIIARFEQESGAAFTVVTTHIDWPVPVERQEGQFRDLGAAVGTVAGPVLVAGDLNSTPWSYALKRFGAEAGLERHTRSLVTYPLRFFYFGDWRDTFPFLPLDHVFSRGPVAVHDVHAAAPTGSDHLPVVVTFSVATE